MSSFAEDPFSKLGTDDSATPGLTRLELPCTGMFSDPVDTTTPLPFHLTSLFLLIESPPPSLSLLLALFTASAETLTTLRLSYDFAGLLHPLLPLVASSLHHLELRTTSSPSDPLPSLSGCTSLRTLYLDVSRAEEAIATLPSPPTLERIGLNIVLAVEPRTPPFRARINPFGESPPPTPSEDVVPTILALLDHPTLARLRQIDFLKLERGPFAWEEGGQELLDELERRSVRFAFAEDLLGVGQL